MPTNYYVLWAKFAANPEKTKFRVEYIIDSFFKFYPEFRYAQKFLTLPDAQAAAAKDTGLNILLVNERIANELAATRKMPYEIFADIIK
jgi:hypothetical protein